MSENVSLSGDPRLSYIKYIEDCKMAHEISLFLQLSQYYSRYRKLLDIAFPDVKAMPSKLHPKSHPSVLGLPFTGALLSLCSRDRILPAVPT